MRDTAHVASTDVLNPTIVLDGQVVGTWKRTIKKDAVLLTPSLFTTLTKAQTRALVASASLSGAFLNMPVKISLYSN